MRIAYQVVGQGSLDLVFVPGFMSNLEVHWEDPGYSRLLRRLAAFSRLILFDKRGTGLSDRVDAAPPAQPRDAHGRRARGDGRRRQRPRGAARRFGRRADGDAVRRHLPGADAGAGALRRLCAFPQMGDAARTRSSASSPRRRRPGAPARRCRISRPAGSTTRISPVVGAVRAAVGEPDGGGGAGADERRASTCAASLRAIRAPTLVIHRRNDARVDPRRRPLPGRKIPGARLVEIPGRDHPLWTGDVDRRGRPDRGVPDRRARRRRSGPRAGGASGDTHLRYGAARRPQWGERSQRFQETLAAAGRAPWRPLGGHTWRSDDVALRRPGARHALRGGAARRGAGNRRGERARACMSARSNCADRRSG